MCETNKVLCSKRGLNVSVSIFMQSDWGTCWPFSSWKCWWIGGWKPCMEDAQGKLWGMWGNCGLLTLSGPVAVPWLLGLNARRNRWERGGGRHLSLQHPEIKCSPKLEMLRSNLAEVLTCSALHKALQKRFGGTVWRERWQRCHGVSSFLCK